MPVRYMIRMSRDVSFRRSNCANSMSKISALLKKNMIHLYRNIPILLFLLMVPSLQVILFFLCIGRKPFDIPVAVSLREDPYNKSLYGNIFLDFIDKKVVKLEYFDSFEDAVYVFKHDNYKGIISIGPNFTSAINKRIKLSMQPPNGSHKKIIDLMRILANQSRINIYPDYTDQFITGEFLREVNKAFLSFRAILSQNLGKGGLYVTDYPLYINGSLSRNKEPPATEWLAPSFIIVLLFFSIISPTAMNLINEKRSGVLNRIYAAGVVPYEFIISYIISNTLILIIQVLILGFFVFIVFEIPCDGSIVLLLSLILLMGLVGMSYGLLISSFCSEENSASIITAASIMPVMLMCGVIWPNETMTYWIRIISDLIPQTHSIKAARYIMYKSWDLSYYTVALGFGLPSVYIFIQLTTATIIFSVWKAQY